MIRKVIFLVLMSCGMLLSHQTVQAQTQVVRGLVVDVEGTPLPGVNIYVKGKESKGVISTIDGKYALSSVAPSDSIYFTYIGYQTQVFRAGNNSTLDVVMEEASTELEETVIVAFQKQKKESVIGSINTINPKELKVPQSNLTTALAGRMSGIISYQTSGEPGKDNAQFFVRGVTTFGYKSSPLILIDGLEVTTEDLARLEPDNIATFSIMKDATATALYGARGANGVIAVTTKVGRKGKVQITTRIETSISAPTKIQSFLDGVSYMEMYNETLRSRTPGAGLYYSKEKIEGTRRGLNPQFFPNVDWYNDLFNDNVMNYKANMTASGGGDVAQYYLSVAYTNEKGLMKVDQLNNFNNNINIDRYNIRANVDFNLTKTTKGAIKTYMLIDRYNGPAADVTNWDKDGIFDLIMKANPVNFPKYYQKDESTKYFNHTLFGNKGNGSFPNPYAEMVRGYKDRSTFTTNAQFQIEQDLSVLTEGLKLRGLASFNAYGQTQNTRQFNPYYYTMDEFNTELGTMYQLRRIVEGEEALSDPATYNNTNSSFYFEGTIQYDRLFGEKHQVGGLLVFQAKEQLNTIDDNENANRTLTTLPSRNLGISGRATYSYDNRYFVEGNFGYNGSEKFAKNHRWGFFPSAGLGWIVTNERFFPESWKKTMPLLKFKATYGLVGNDAISEAWDRFFYLSDVSTSDSAYGYTWGRDGNVTYNGYVINRYANPNVSWEVSTKANYGFEMNLLDIFTVQLDYFTEHRTNIYMSRESVPASMGLTAAIKSNLGEAKSHGFDGSIDANWSINKNWWMSGRFNYTYATSEMVVNSEPQYNTPWRTAIGQPLKQWWGYVAERLFIDEDDIINSPSQFGVSEPTRDYMPGDIKYVDLNKDGKIDEDDQAPIGHPEVPEIVYGFGLSAGYKNWDFSFFFQGAGNVSFFIDPASMAPFVNERNALSIIAEDHWSDSNPNPQAFWPRLNVNNSPNNNHTSTWWLRDGSYLRLKSLEVGYSLPQSLMKKWKMNTVRFYFSGTNLLSFSAFKMWDPEMGRSGMGYPNQRIYNLGLNIAF